MDGAIDVICFDLGGVLVRICRSFDEARARAGITARVLPESARVSTRDAAQAYQRGDLSHDAYFDAIASAAAGVYTRAELLAIHHAWTLDEYPGVPALVDDLRAAGRRLACLSNTNAAHWERLAPASPPARREYPSLARLDVMLASHLLRVTKPDPAIYALAQAALGVAPDRVLFFDDLPANVAAARASGWCAEQVDPHGDPASEIRVHLARRGIL